MIRKPLIITTFLFFLSLLFFSTSASADRNIYINSLDYHFTAPDGWEEIEPSTLRGLKRQNPELQAKFFLPLEKQTVIEVYHQTIPTASFTALFDDKNPIYNEERKKFKDNYIKSLEEKHTNDYFGVDVRAFSFLDNENKISISFTGSDGANLRSFNQELLFHKDKMIVFHAIHPYTFNEENNVYGETLEETASSFQTGKSPEMILAEAKAAEKIKEEKIKNEERKKEAIILAEKEIKAEEKRKQEEKKNKANENKDRKPFFISLFISLSIIICAIYIYRKKFVV